MPIPHVDAKRALSLNRRLLFAQALSHFLDVMPEQIAAAMVKPITGALLPPNIALLAACRENATKLMNESFRGAYLLFRAYLYRTLVALPSSALTAKVSFGSCPSEQLDVPPSPRCTVRVCRMHHATRRRCNPREALCLITQIHHFPIAPPPPPPPPPRLFQSLLPILCNMNVSPGTQCRNAACCRGHR